nr:hypothetical protein [uncultured Emticicia sp.]
MTTYTFLLLQLIVFTGLGQNENLSIKGDNDVCAGAKASYSYTISDKSIKFKDWVLPEGAEKLSENKNKITVKFAKNGKYELKAIFISEDNALSSQTFKVMVREQPKISIAGLDRVYSKSDNVFEASQNSDGDIFTWSVYLSQGGTNLLHGNLGVTAKNFEDAVMFSYPNKSSIMLDFRRPGIYELKVFNKGKNGCESPVQTKIIKAYLAPENRVLKTNMP